MADATMAPPPTRTQMEVRTEGAMLAAAVGDALGWPAEMRGNRVGGMRGLSPGLDFVAWRRREGGRYAPHERLIPPGTYSDDTQLLLAVARSRQRGVDWWTHLTRTELPLWLVYQLGGGGATRRAASAWNHGYAPWSEHAKPEDRRRYYEAGGNGVVMRILPHVIAGAEDETYSGINAHVTADGITTHGHPRALLGAQAVGYALWRGLRWTGRLSFGALLDAVIEGVHDWASLQGIEDVAPDWPEQADSVLPRDYSELWERTVEEMLGLLDSASRAISHGSTARVDATLRELGALGNEGGAGTRTAATALYLASRYVTEPQAGLLAGAFARGADTDTIACVTGALLGCLASHDWASPLAQNLQDAGYIRGVARRIDNDAPQEEEWDFRSQRALVRRIVQLGEGDELALPVFGRASITRVEDPDAKSGKDIRIWWLRTELGQTLSVSRVADAPAPWRDRRRPAPDRVRAHKAPREDRADPGLEEGPVVWHQIDVSDLDQAVAFYTGVLRLRLMRRAGQMAFLAPNLAIQEVASGQLFRSTDPNQRILLFVDPVGLTHRVDALKAADAPVMEVIEDGPRSVVRCADPDGHLIELRIASTRN